MFGLALCAGLAIVVMSLALAFGFIRYRFSLRRQRQWAVDVNSRAHAARLAESERGSRG